jgi:hypothetical protein
MAAFRLLAAVFAVAARVVSSQFSHGASHLNAALSATVNGQAFQAFGVPSFQSGDSFFLPDLPTPLHPLHPYWSGPSYAQNNQMMHTQYVNANQMASTIALHGLQYTTMEKKAWDSTLGLEDHPVTKANDAMQRYVLKDILAENKAQKSAVSKALAELNADIKKYPKSAHQWPHKSMFK